MPPSLYLPAAKLHPRLEKLIAQGEVLAANDKVTERELAQWAKDTLFVLDKIEYLALDIFETFQTLEVNMGLRRDQPVTEEGRRMGLLPAISSLKSQLGLLEDEMESSSAAHSKGSKVFVGHGRNSAWMELEKFLDKDLHIEVVEFNSIPTAGMTIIDRLKSMLDSVGFAFLIMTAEDHVGKKQDAIRARQNVIHEIGLFQGRLGFHKAIILLEEGCQKFSNIDGLVYIPFPKGNIRAAFHDIQRTLTAAGLVKPIAP